MWKADMFAASVKKFSVSWGETVLFHVHLHDIGPEIEQVGLISNSTFI